MRGIRLLLACGLVWFLGSPGWAQPSGDQVQQMRQQLQSLQEKLSALESDQPESRGSRNWGARGCRLKKRSRN